MTSPISAQAVLFQIRCQNWAGLPPVPAGRQERCRGAVAAPTLRFTSLVVGKYGLERVQIVPGGEGLEGFPVLTMAQVALEHLFQGRLEIAEGDALKDLTADGVPRAEPAPDEDVVAIDRFAGHFDLGAQQADVPHVVLGAGVRATGEVDIDRPVELKLPVEMLHQLERVTLRIGAGEFAV